MNPRILELALRKQRLQMSADAQRSELQRHLATVDSVLDTTDRLRDHIRNGVEWAREKAPLLSGAALVLLVTRPRRALRLVQRGWVGWLLWRRLRGARGGALNPAIASVLLRLLGRLRAMLG